MVYIVVDIVAHCVSSAVSRHSSGLVYRHLLVWTHFADPMPPCGRYCLFVMVAPIQALPTYPCSIVLLPLRDTLLRLVCGLSVSVDPLLLWIRLSAVAVRYAVMYASRRESLVVTLAYSLYEFMALAASELERTS